jgi:hypothetical protein
VDPLRPSGRRGTIRSKDISYKIKKMLAANLRCRGIVAAFPGC